MYLMKYSITTFKSLKVCLKELEPFIRNGQHLETGKPFKEFGFLRSREILANWLLCVVAHFEQKSQQFKICTDPQGGDGTIYNATKKQAWLTEHILVSQKNNESDHMQSLILKQIEKKQKKGGFAYASGKMLIVFLNKQGGEWYPNRVAKNLHDVDFESVWVVGLQKVVDGKYLYNVVRVFPAGCPVWCPIWQISINKKFDDWDVKKIQ